ncbi:MAG: hypothetical protein KDD64_02900 [Bdellovibrionales bacterium]|nr:hypothetical protein [Bdellovibrionales bacterium]
MTKFFCPFYGGEPATLVINGHRLVIVSKDVYDIEEHLTLLGGDCCKVYLECESAEEEKEYLEQLADQINGGVVVSPDEGSISELLVSLQDELPWIQ